MTELVLPRRARPWRDHPRETLAAALLLATGAVALAGVSWANPSLGLRSADAPDRALAASQPALPAALPLAGALRAIDPQTAAEVNREIPLGASGPAAPAFAFRARQPADLERALECLSSAIYYEAGQESEKGQRAVAQVILNRVRHPAFPASVCGVVYEGSTRMTGCQFTFTCDGSLARAPGGAAWTRARRIAAEALGGTVEASVGLATHYHADYVVPYWATTLDKSAVEGRHIFYRWSGGWGRPGAFAQGYAGREAAPAALRRAALAVPHQLPSVLAARAEGEIADGELPAGIALAATGKDRKVIAKYRPEAREAAEKAVVVPYVERSGASDNLRFALEGAPAENAEAAFGRLDSAAGGRQSPGS